MYIYVHLKDRKHAHTLYVKFACVYLQRRGVTPFFTCPSAPLIIIEYVYVYIHAYNHTYIDINMLYTYIYIYTTFIYISPRMVIPEEINPVKMTVRI